MAEQSNSWKIKEVNHGKRRYLKSSGCSPDKRYEMRDGLTGPQEHLDQRVPEKRKKHCQMTRHKDTDTITASRTPPQENKYDGWQRKQ